MRIFFSVIMAVVALLSLSAQPKKRISLDDIYKNYIFRDGNNMEIEFSEDGVSYYVNDGSVIKKKSLVDTNFSQDVLNASSLITDDGTPAYLCERAFDKTETKIIFFSQKQKIYRWSFNAVIWIYDFSNKTFAKLRNEPVMYPSFSPDGKRIAYVMNRDIWVYDFGTQKHTQLTLGGEERKKMNGMSDWVYEEEFELLKAYEWMPDNKSIAYISMDESKVKEFEFQYNSTATYPSVYKYKYPKAGENNSVVGLHVVDVENRSIRTLSVLDATDKAGMDFYLPRIYVTAEGNICAMKLNRLQNKMQLLYYPQNATEPTIVYEETDKYYVDLSHFYINFYS